MTSTPAPVPPDAEGILPDIGDAWLWALGPGGPGCPGPGVGVLVWP